MMNDKMRAQPDDAPGDPASPVDAWSDEAMRLRIEQILRLDALAAGLAHEIRNPLATIMQAGDFIDRRECSRSPEIAAAVDSIREGVRRIEAAVSRLEQRASSQTDLSSVNLNRLVAAAIDARRDELQAAVITAEVDLGPDVPEIAVDVPSVRHLLDRLVSLALARVRSPEALRGAFRFLGARTRLGSFQGQRRNDRRPGMIMPGEPCILLEIEGTAGSAARSATTKWPGPEAIGAAGLPTDERRCLRLAQSIMDVHLGAFQMFLGPSDSADILMVAAFRRFSP